MANTNTDLETFSVMPAHVLRPWLLKERDEIYRHLISALDPSQLAQWQGKGQLVERMLHALDKAKRSS